MQHPGAVTTSNQDTPLGELGEPHRHGRSLPADKLRDACRRFATALRSVAVQRPATFQLVGLQPLDSPSALRPVEQLLGVLVRSGFAAPRALAIYRAIVSYARGYALAEATGFTVDATRPAGARRLYSLPVDRFPILAGQAEELAALEADDAYLLGLEAMLRGFDEPAASGAGAPRADHGPG